MPRFALSLFRHAKSTWDDPALPDHERPLAPRGIKAATRMSHYLAGENLIPDLVLCSDAVRTRATLTLLFTPLDQTAPQTIFTRDLYLAEPNRILAVLAQETQRTAPRAPPPRHVMIIGHNPGLQHLALSLPGGGRRADIERLAKKFPTAALARFTFAAQSWSDLKPGNAVLDRFVTPKALKD